MAKHGFFSAPLDIASNKAKKRNRKENQLRFEDLPARANDKHYAIGQAAVRCSPLIQGIT
ncbi:hypothetical protein SAMN04515695_3570 [Pseudovibrio sp. Tun.PSC04-5.I4]|nr:hypothetical protein SAMN04515695_3570 [Pseudovibrio sp. Tun.PSC04-5.I4]